MSIDDMVWFEVEKGSVFRSFQSTFLREQFDKNVKKLIIIDIFVKKLFYEIQSNLFKIKKGRIVYGK
ncbi:MAG: hypothetical protein ACFFCG_09065 [Promethearchaeota archaeon]